MATATEVTSVLDVTATGESGKALRAEERLAERQHPSAEALNLKKLTEWCKHRMHIDNKLVRVYLSDICSNLSKTDLKSIRVLNRRCTSEEDDKRRPQLYLPNHLDPSRQYP
ncbi:uncharacterized protein LOC126175509 [Schistocerca cancellata]|uniref:uncharacterized protein LOC126175509 n=1 Tax=Schistocerca cancellata TaxID=274614 RepID=UPI0021199361|nr:uncharacterized protein LOC126175509 [Schistocerca cancellata]